MIRRIGRYTLCLLVAVGLLSGCNANGSANQAEKSSNQIGEVINQTEESAAQTQEGQTSLQVETTQMETEESSDDIDILMHQMTLRQKVGQLFIIRPDALDVSKTQEKINGVDTEAVTEMTDRMLETLQEYPVGGIVMFSKNIINPEQITAFNQSLQNASDIPLFISVDEEGGSVSRLANHPAFALKRYESAAAVGAGGDTLEAQEMGSTIGAYLKLYGFNMNFAPDADVNTNPNNPVIGTRAFSSDAQTAARMAGAVAEGMRQQGIIPTFKHFPGHGDTAEDSHKGIAISYKTEEEMAECEWLPFEEAGEWDCIMVGHISVPEVTGNLIPATMSDKVVTDILKNRLGFKGMVITDSLSMLAITDVYDPGEAALGALQAGCDVLLMPNGLQEAFDAVISAAEDGSLSEERIDESVRHILEYKLEYGILLTD